MKLTSEQISDLGAVLPELAGKLEAGECVTVEPEVKRWDPQEGDYIADSYGVVRRVDYELFSSHGTARKNRTAAERLAHDQRIFNRLHAYREEFAPGYVVPPAGAPAWSVYIHKVGCWDVGVDRDFRVPTCVYMPEAVIEELSRKLNSGEVVL